MITSKGPSIELCRHERHDWGHKHLKRINKRKTKFRTVLCKIFTVKTSFRFVYTDKIKKIQPERAQLLELFCLFFCFCFFRDRHYDFLGEKIYHYARVP